MVYVCGVGEKQERKRKKLGGEGACSVGEKGMREKNQKG